MTQVANTVTVTDELKAVTGSIKTTVMSIDKNTLVKKQATANIKIEKENVLQYIKTLLATPTEEIEANNPLFIGTNILYLYLQSQLAHLEVQDKSTEKTINLILWVVQKTAIDPFRFITTYKDLEVLKKYFPNFAITDAMDKHSLQIQLDEVIKFEQFITNYLNESSPYPTPSFLRKSDELKPLFTALRGDGMKLKDFDYTSIATYNNIIKALRNANA